MKHVLFSILPIFLTIASGYLIRRNFLKSEEFWKSAETITYYFLFPCLLVLKISAADFSATHAAVPLVTAIAATLIVGVLAFTAKKIFNPNNPLFTSIFQGSTRYNSYVFIGMSNSLFGGQAAAITGIFIAYMIVITNVLSVLVMNHYSNTNKKRPSDIVLALLKNPLIAFTILGIVLNQAGVKIEGFLFEYMHSIGSAASPISLLAVGAGLKLVMSRDRVFATVFASTLKLLVLPAITIGLLKYLNISGIEAQVAILYSCVPTAGNAYILARQMGGDSTSIASIISTTTLGSILTVTLIFGFFI